MATVSTQRTAAATKTERGGPLRWHTMRAVAVLGLLAASVVAVVVAPTLMPASYSWVRHSVSESAAQGVQDAWVARLGFLLLGFAVLVLAGVARGRWGPLASALHRLYGVSIVAAAAFAHRPWLDVPFDAFEDVLHSAAATGVGFGFTVGVALVAFRRGPDATAARSFDGVAVLVGLAISVMVVNVVGVAGLAQRFMFGVGYLWYGLEALRTARASMPTGRAPSAVAVGAAP